MQERWHAAGLQRHAGLAPPCCALCFATEHDAVLNVRLPSDCEWLQPAAPTKSWVRCAALAEKRYGLRLAGGWWVAGWRALYWLRCDDWWMAL